MCKIEEPDVNPVYRKFNKKLKLEKKIRHRYESEFGIMYKISYPKFLEIIKTENIKTSKEFITYAKDYFNEIDF